MEDDHRQFSELVKFIQDADLYGVHQILASNPAIVDFADCDGRTPLHYAARYGHRTIAFAFLYYPNDILNRERMDKKDDKEYSPLDIAVKYQHTDVSMLLRGVDAKSNDTNMINNFFAAVLAGDTRLMRQLCQLSHGHGVGPKNCPLVDVCNEQGHTPLILAASVGIKRSVKWLCKNGADKRIKDRVDMTALDYAKRSQARVGTDEIVDTLHKDFRLLTATKLAADLEQERNKEQAATRPRRHTAGDLESPSTPSTFVFSRQAELEDAQSDLAAQQKRHDAEVAELIHEESGDPLFWKIFIPLQVILIILMGVLVKYDNTVDSTSGGSPFMGNPASTGSNVFPSYAMFQDVHVMIFIGFGFLMTFLRKYSFSSVGLNFAVAALAIQCHVVFGGMWEHLWADHTDTKIALTANSFLLADFGAAAVLITFGALLGKTTPSQLLVIAVFEINFMVINELINTQSLNISDMGGSMVVHTFGAYFGLAASWVLTPVKTRINRDPLRDNASVYRSDLFAMIGTLFLWIYWPSFTAAPAGETSQERAQVNTLLALVGSCLSAYIFSGVLRKDHEGNTLNKFDMVDIQNATLAGGVAIGTACDMDVHPGGALFVGICAGALSVFGYTTLQPLLEEKLGLYDTCGVNNLHGMPGILAGLIGGFATLASPIVLDQCVVAHVWPGRYHGDVSTCAVYTTSCAFTCVERRTSGEQAGYQFLYLLITILVSIGTGLLTGKLVSFMPSPREYMVDDVHWEVPSYEHPFYFDKLSASKLHVGHMEDALFDPEAEFQTKKPQTTTMRRKGDGKVNSRFIKHKIDWVMSLAENEAAADEVAAEHEPLLSKGFGTIRRPNAERASNASVTTRSQAESEQW